MSNMYCPTCGIKIESTMNDCWNCATITITSTPDMPIIITEDGKKFFELEKEISHLQDTIHGLCKGYAWLHTKRTLELYIKLMAERKEDDPEIKTLQYTKELHYFDDRYYHASIIQPGGKEGHSVVMQNCKIVHDPSPSSKDFSLQEIRELYLHLGYYVVWTACYFDIEGRLLGM